MKDIVIVDNSAYSFGFNVNNGIPILSFYDSKEDIELFHLIDYLKMLSSVEDVREVNREAFKLLDIVEEAIMLSDRMMEVGEASTI